MKRILYGLVALLISYTSFAWNAMGHKVVAQIAYDNLTPEAKKVFNRYNTVINKVFPAGNFVEAAIWLDVLRFDDVHWFDALHYIDIPFTNDDSPLPPVQPINASWGIKAAVKILKSSRSSESEKGLSLRILIHTVGDIHQPLHAVALITEAHPQGDKGGLLFPLGLNPISSDLHSYWDNGGGILVGQTTNQQIRNKAHQLEEKWPCPAATKSSNADQWIKSSHELAVSKAYTIKPGSVPSKIYQLHVQNLSEKQISLAGCRLANLLNNIA